MAKKNLLFLTIIPIWGGATKNLLELIKRLDKNIFNSFLVLPDDRGVIYTEAIKRGIQVKLMDMPFIHLSRNPFKLFFFVFKIIQVNIRFFSLIKKLYIDMVICNTIQDSLFVCIPSKILKRKLVIYIKGILDKRWKKIFRSRICDLFADKVVAVSKRVRDDIVKYMKNQKKAMVIYEGIDVDFFRNNAAKSDIYNTGQRCFRIINIGNIAELKGQKLLIRALLEKEFENIDFKVFFIGEANFERDLAYKREMEELIGGSSLEGKVVFTGFRKNVGDYIKYSDLLVHCPVLEEGFGLVIIEAFSMEKVVVATRVGGIPEIIENGLNGFLSDTDHKDLANKIMYVYNNQDGLGQIKSNGLSTVKEKFTLDKQIRKTQEVYCKLLEV